MSISSDPLNTHIFYAFTTADISVKIKKKLCCYCCHCVFNIIDIILPYKMPTD